MTSLDDGVELSLAHTPRSPGTRLVDDQEVLDHLVGLIGPESSGPPALWLTFLTEADEVLPLAVPIGDLPRIPDRDAVRTISSLITEVLAEVDEAAHVLVALVRADGGDHGAFERRWAHAVWRAADAADWVLRLVVAVGAGRARVLDRARCTPTLG